MDATNIKIGACDVSFDGADIGHTKGGVTVSYAPEYSDITADEYGNTPIDKSLMGEQLTVRVPLAESQVANIKKAIPMATLAGSGNGRATIGKSAGDRLADEAKQLVLHPKTETDGDLSDDVVFHKAVVHDTVEIGFNNENERIIEVEFIALIDTSKADGNWLGHIGDSTD